MPEKQAFKDVFNENSVKKIGDRVKEVYLQFDSDAFLRSATENFKNEELKERSLSITKAMKKHLPDDLQKAWKILHEAMDKSICYDNYSWTNGLDSFILMPFWTFYSAYLLDNFDLSMKALYKLTKLFTSEDAIRPFIVAYPDEIISVLEKWAEDEDENVRRLVSEWTRPLLPWAQKLPEFVKNPEKVLNLLSKLVHDESLYVRRSVANNLNDIAKDNPEDVIKFLKAHKKDTPEFDWLKKHALRTLIKKWDPDALALVWVTEFKWRLQDFKLNSTEINIWDDLEFSFELEAFQYSHLVVDYAIGFLMKNWKTSKKVFKLKKFDIKEREKRVLTKKHSFKIITTRTYYPGGHLIEIFVNWKSYHLEAFKLYNK